MAGQDSNLGATDYENQAGFAQRCSRSTIGLLTRQFGRESSLIVCPCSVPRVALMCPATCPHGVVEEVRVAHSVVDEVDVGPQCESRIGVAEPHLHDLRLRPFANRSDAHVCRNVWNPTQGTAAVFAAGFSMLRHNQSRSTLSPRDPVNISRPGRPAASKAGEPSLLRAECRACRAGTSARHHTLNMARTAAASLQSRRPASAARAPR